MPKIIIITICKCPYIFILFEMPLGDRFKHGFYVGTYQIFFLKSIFMQHNVALFYSRKPYWKGKINLCIEVLGFFALFILKFMKVPTSQ